MYVRSAMANYTLSTHTSSAAVDGETPVVIETGFTTSNASRLRNVGYIKPLTWAYVPYTYNSSS